jgi:hypothetical protein
LHASRRRINGKLVNIATKWTISFGFNRISTSIVVVIKLYLILKHFCIFSSKLSYQNLFIKFLEFEIEIDIDIYVAKIVNY